MLRVILVSLICVVPSLCESEMGSIAKPESTKLQGVQCTPEDMDTGNNLANKFCELSTKVKENKRKGFENCIRRNIVEYGRSDCLPEGTNLQDLNDSLCVKHDEETQKILCCYGNKINREGKKDMTEQMLQKCSSTYFFPKN